MMPVEPTPDLELIAQRILKLSEIATLEHLEQLLASQAHAILELAQPAENAVSPVRRTR